MAFRLDTPYYPIPGLRPEGTFGVIVEMLLKSRLRLHLETNRERYDEDVNAYMVGVLVSYIDPKYHEAISDVLSRYDIDIYHAVTKAEERHQIYWIYKVNADDLLVSLGVFRRLWQEAKAELSRMSRYYSYASEYQRRIYGKTTAVGEIQMKLADLPERYLSILSGARFDYLHFMERIGLGELDTFTRRLRKFEKELPVKAKVDELLDAYSGWLKGDRTLTHRQRLLELLGEIKKLDPNFHTEPFQDIF